MANKAWPTEIWDPVEEADDSELIDPWAHLRPTRPGLIQVECEAPDAFTLFWFPDGFLEEVDEGVALDKLGREILAAALLTEPNATRASNLTMVLADRVIALAKNFRLAQVELDTFRAYWIERRPPP